MEAKYKVTFAIEGSTNAVQNFDLLLEATNHAGSWFVDYLPLVKQERIQKSPFWVSIKNEETDRYVIWAIGFIGQGNKIANKKLAENDFYVSIITKHTNEIMSHGQSCSDQVEYARLNFYQAVGAAFTELANVDNLND